MSVKYKIVNQVKSLLYGNKGEPYTYFDHTLRFKVGTRPARMKYIDSEYWDVRNDLLQLAYLKEIFTQDCVLWDIGACYGEYGIIVATMLENKANKVFCFEPDEVAARVLKENLRLNGLEQAVTVFESAVGEKTGKIVFENLNGSTTSHIAFTNDASSPNSRVVDCIALNELSASLPEPTLVKVDIEGAELKMLLSDTGLFQNKKIKFLVELHPWAYPEFKADFEKLCEKITSSGREISLLDEKKNKADLPFYGTIVF
jgi:FkbM family methyltransferase